jgi:hypothetical protein
MSEKLTPFSYSKSILNKKVYLEDMSEFSVFLMGKLFSVDQNFVSLANFLNRIGVHQLSKRAMYDFYFYTIPETRRFLKYPKKEVDLKTTKYLMEYYSIGEKEAKDYLELLPKEDVKRIVNLYEKRGIK